jgi:hypothetical protein
LHHVEQSFDIARCAGPARSQTQPARDRRPHGCKIERLTLDRGGRHGLARPDLLLEFSAVAEADRGGGTE